MPAIRLKARRSVITEPALNLAVNGNAVVIIEANQLTQFQRAGQRTYLVRDTFHQTAITKKDIGVMIDQIQVGLVELCGHSALGNCHPYRIAYSLPKRSGRCFNPGGIAILRMAWCF